MAILPTGSTKKGWALEPIEYNDHKYGVEIAVDDIEVDPSVQRSIVPSRARKLARLFDPGLLGEILVSQRSDGRYWVIDGQHRWQAAKNAGVMSLACEVFTGLSKADEARLFMGRNDRANIARVDHDRTLATAEDPDTLNVQMAAQSAGFVFIADRLEDSTYRDRAAAVSIIQSAERKRNVEINGVDHLGHCFEFYARIYGNQERPESLVLKGLSRLFLKNDHLDEDRLYEKLRGIPGQQLVAGARRYREEVSLNRGISTTGAMAEQIGELYNRGLPGKSEKKIRP